jgi:hypothetical protein
MVSSVRLVAMDGERSWVGVGRWERRKEREGGMEPDDLPCSRNARPEKDMKGAARPSFLLAERAR